MGLQQIIVVSQRLRAILQRTLRRYHQDFTQRKCNALTELILPSDAVSPPSIEHQPLIKSPTPVVIIQLPLQNLWNMQGDGFGNLVVDPCFVTRHPLERGNIGGIRTKGCLRQETHRTRIRSMIRRPGRRRRRRCKGPTAVRRCVIAANLATWIQASVQVDVRLALFNQLADVVHREAAYRQNRPLVRTGIRTAGNETIARCDGLHPIENNG